MAKAVAQRTSVGDTVVQFLEGTMARYGSRPVLLFKPGFRYQRWSYEQLWEGAAHLWSNPFWYVANTLLGNGFPVAKEGPVRSSLENMGRILHSGCSILIYPEGGLTIGGPIKPFLNGAGLVAVEGRAPVVPMRLCIHDMGAPPRFALLKRGNVEVRFGEPLTFTPGTDCQEATQVIENAVKAL